MDEKIRYSPLLFELVDGRGGCDSGGECVLGCGKIGAQVERMREVTSTRHSRQQANWHCIQSAPHRSLPRVFRSQTFSDGKNWLATIFKIAKAYECFTIWYNVKARRPRRDRFTPPGDGSLLYRNHLPHVYVPTPPHNRNYLLHLRVMSLALVTTADDREIRLILNTNTNITFKI